MTIQVDIIDDIAAVTLTRPESLNSLSFSVLKEFDAVIAQLENSSVRGLVVVGSGEKAFCAGADIPELMGRSLQQTNDGAALGQTVFNRLGNLRFPSVAIIHGYAFGGGLELALACTFRVATSRARMGLPEVKLGLIPGYGGTQRLPRLIGEARALEIIMSGRTVEADEAERIGLVNKIDDAGQPDDIGRRFLAPFLQHGLLAIGFAREAVQRGMQTSLNEGLHIERDLSTLAYRTEDAAEGMLAFTEKRPAIFKDQ